MLAAIFRIRQYWKLHNITISSLKESNIESLGKFIQGLTLDELNELPDPVKKIAIQKLGEFTGLPKDKLKARANFAFLYLKVRIHLKGLP